MGCQEDIMPTAVAVLFPWSDTYCVKIAMVDSQHKVLVDLINELHQAIMARRGNESLGRVLATLVKYTKSHVAAEEGLLQANQYPDLVIHKAEHEQFTQTIVDFQGRFQRNEVAVTIDVMYFLEDWLAKHLMGSTSATFRTFPPRECVSTLQENACALSF
jgi:hemerythrin-like metal-binding protein